MNHIDEEEDELDRLQREWDQEASAKPAPRPTAVHASLQVKEDGEKDAPAASVRRVRIPTSPSSPAPQPAPASEQASFEDQLADLVGDEEAEWSPAQAFASVKGQPRTEVTGESPSATEPSEGEVSPFPKGSGGERRRGQHRPGLKRAPRFMLTEDDERIIEFLSRARYGTASTVSFLLAKELTTVGRRLRKLTERGYLAKRNGAVAGSLYYATEFGMEEIDSPIRVEQNDFALRAVKHTLAAANVLALLLGGTAPKRMAEELLHADHPLWEHFVSEKELRRRISQQQALLNPNGTPWKWDGPGLRARKMRLLSQWHAGEAVGGAQEERDAPWTYLILPSAKPGRPGFHVPDAVLSYPRVAETGEPQAVAVEVELHAVNEEKLENVVAAYADEFASPYCTYGKVVWLCRDEKVARAVLAMAKRLMPREFAPRFKVLLLCQRGLSGVSFTHRQANFTAEQKAKRDANLSSNRFTRGLYKSERQALTEARATAADAQGGE